VVFLDSIANETLAYSLYYAPRGRERLYRLGNQISQRYLSPKDQLIGFIGDSGAGKSVLIKGMFPGLELTNDDEGVNVRPLPLLNNLERGFFGAHTYHIDVRFEMAFAQIYELADAIRMAIHSGKRVLVEHFELISEQMDYNANLIIGIGEEVLVTRPGFFGPLPKDIADIVLKSLKYRKMAHTAEDITAYVLESKYGVLNEFGHGDVKRGFVMELDEKISVDLEDVEKDVKEIIESEMDVSCNDDNHIILGDKILLKCSCPRVHIKNTADIQNFELVKEFFFNPYNKKYSIVGIVGTKGYDVKDLNKLIL
jgi:tRNA A37 threonylcarbamoyladenosine biosynthesis protein TsaE